MFVKPHDVPPVFCFNVQTGMKFRYNSCCLYGVGVVKSSVSVCMFKQNIRGKLRGFTNINKTEICLDLIRNTLQYIPVRYYDQNEHFPRKYHKVVVVFCKVHTLKDRLYIVAGVWCPKY